MAADHCQFFYADFRKYTPHLHISTAFCAERQHHCYALSIAVSQHTFYTFWADHTWRAGINVLRGHKDTITSVAFSPGGKQIVSGSWDKSIRVWDAETGEMVSGPFEGHTDGVRSVAFSPDGKRIVSGSEDKSIHVWDAGLARWSLAPSKDTQMESGPSHFFPMANGLSLAPGTNPFVSGC